MDAGHPSPTSPSLIAPTGAAGPPDPAPRLEHGQDHRHQQGRGGHDRWEDQLIHAQGRGEAGVVLAGLVGMGGYLGGQGDQDQPLSSRFKVSLLPPTSTGPARSGC